MALDRKELDQILSTLNKYAKKKLTPEFLLKLDHEDRFPNEVLADLYDNIGLHLVFIDESDDGLGGGAYDVYRVFEATARLRVGIATGVPAPLLGAAGAPTTVDVMTDTRPATATAAAGEAAP